MSAKQRWRWLGTFYTCSGMWSHLPRFLVASLLKLLKAKSVVKTIVLPMLSPAPILMKDIRRGRKKIQMEAFSGEIDEKTENSVLDRKEETLRRTIQKILNECERDKLTDICKEQSLAEKNAEIISCTDPDSSVITSPQADKMEDIEVKFEFALDNYVVEEIIPMEDNQFGKNPVSNYPLYYCNASNYTTKHIIQFRQHLKIHLTLNYSRDECDFKGRNGKSISKHKMQHCNCDEKRTICTDSTVHSCDECNYTTKTKGNFNMHLRTHLNLTYFCEQCEFKGKNEK